MDDSTAYFFDYLHFVTAVDKRTGKLRWRRGFTYATDPGFRIGFGMAIAGGRLVVGDLDVFGLDRATGAIVWRFSPVVLPREQAGRGHLTTDGTLIYTGSVTGRVYAIDAATGMERWRSTVADSGFAVNDPVLSDGVIYAGLSMGSSPYDGGVVAVRASDGQRLWLAQFPTNALRPTGVLTQVGITAGLVFAGAEDDRVVALDRQTGAVRFSISGDVFRAPEVQAPSSSVSFAITGTPHVVVIGSHSGMVVGLDGTDAHLLWKSRADGSPFDIQIFGDLAYIACVTALDIFRANDGTIAWSVPVADFQYNLSYDAFSAAPTVDADRVYVGGDHGLYAFKKR